MSIYINKFTSELVCILYIPSLVNCANFIEIRPVVLLYQQFKVLNLIIFSQK